MSWGGLNPALTAWRNGINQRFPKRGTLSDGGYADKVHGSSSQHQPDADGTVDAFDQDVNLLGSSTPAGTETERALQEALKLDFEADPRAQLWIHRREIANRDIDDWRERDYNGESPHIEHCHWQSRQARERDGSPWLYAHTDALLRRMNGDDMTPDDLLNFDSVPNLYGDKSTNPTVTVRTALKAAVAADVRLARVESKVDAILEKLNAG